MTLNLYKPKCLLFGFFLIFFSFTSFSQVLHEVTVQNFGFSPDVLIINVGDTVRWTNTEGSHNVNGSISSYPMNPESFGNSVGEGWVYEFVFTLAGRYDYHCDPHLTLGMMGSITVEEVSTAIELSTNNSEIRIYPNPASSYVILDLGPSSTYSPGQSIVVYDMNGRLMYYSKVTNAEIIIDTQNFNKGQFIYSLQKGKDILETGHFEVQ